MKLTWIGSSAARKPTLWPETKGTLYHHTNFLPWVLLILASVLSGMENLLTNWLTLSLPTAHCPLPEICCRRLKWRPCYVQVMLSCWLASSPQLPHC